MPLKSSAMRNIPSDATTRRIESIHLLLVKKKLAYALTQKLV